MDQMLSHQVVPLFPLVNANSAKPTLDTDLPLVRTGLLLGQEETRCSEVAQGKYPRALPVRERLSPFLLRVLASVTGTLGLGANRRWSKPPWHISATFL